LSNSIAAEASIARAAENANTDKINTEIQDRKNADTTLNNAINKEVTDRTTAISNATTTLNNSIN
jgi:hypothetical protein